MARYASKVVAQAEAWIGCKESNGSHKKIIDVYNSHKPLARGYKLKYTDAWCAGFVSAVAIKVGYTDIIPTEVGCGAMIELCKEMGIWHENENYTPKAGDIIFYDWDDSGKGDNKGGSDHVGIVQKVVSKTIYVIEGNYGDAVKVRKIAVNGKYIRGYALPKYDKEKDSETKVTTKPAAKKSTTEIAKEVIAGKWGTGSTRKKKLEAAGYNYSTVQAKVNELLSKKTTSKKSTTEIAKEVIAGKWGNGADRKKRLQAAGYDYNAVQKKVNQLL